MGGILHFKFQPQVFPPAVQSRTLKREQNLAGNQSPYGIIQTKHLRLERIELLHVGNSTW